MQAFTSTGSLNGFDKSLDELSHLADSFKLHDQELEQQHRLEWDKLKSRFDIQLQLEKERVKQLQDLKQNLTDELKAAAKTHIDTEHQYTLLKTKYECVLEELKEIKDQHEKKRIRIESFDRITDMFKKDKAKFEETIQQLNRENEVLQEKLTELQVPVAATTTTTASHGIPSELIPLVQQAIAENLDLKKSLSDREKELQTLKEQTNRMQSEDPQVVEQRLLQMVSKLKSDFSLMYHNQATFFLEKIDLLKQEQRDNIASLYRH